MIDYSYLRPQKAVEIKKCHSLTFSKKAALNAYEYRQAVVLPLKKDSEEGPQYGLGGVVKGDEFIPISGIEGRYGGYYSFTAPSYRNEKVVFCGALILQWGRFLLESCTRLWYFLNDDLSIDKYVFIVGQNESTGLTGNYLEFFRLLGVESKVEIVNTPTQYETVVVPEIGYRRREYYSDQYKAIFDRLVENALKKREPIEKADKVFLSRSNFHKAIQSECGLEMLDNYFVNNGFKIIYPEKLPLAEVIRYLRNADLCAAESGTLPHNYLFCEDQKDVIIIERQATVNEMQANVDSIRNLNVTYIDANMCLYVPNAGYGVYYISYNSLFERFTRDKGYVSPDLKYLNEKAVKKDLKRYLRLYQEAYGYGWAFEKWQLDHADLYYEAYQDGLPVLDKYLSRKEPLFLRDYFSIHYAKQLVKRFIKR